jgi:hypothetical protein
MARSQPFCSPAHFPGQLTPKRKLPYPELVSLPCPDTARHRHRLPVMGKVRGTIITTGSIANT